jgi:hypothetical protein
MIALFALGLLLAGALSAQSGSNVKGKPCPTLLLEKQMVQGLEIKQKDFEGKVVFFLFYQRDCEGCELQAMPRVQKLFERYQHSKCVIVMVINTAFDKEFSPHLAQIEETRAHLRMRQWTMPVARDLDERSYALFSIDGESGTPQAVVLDETGKVREHGWFSNDKEMKRIERGMDALVDRLNCDCIRKPRDVSRACKPAYDAIVAGDYAKAYKEAETVVSFRRPGDQDRVDAEYLKDFIEILATTRIEKIKDEFAFDPVSALTRADEVVDKFKGIAPVTEFENVASGWRESDTVKDFVTIREEFEKLESEIAGKPEISAEESARLVDRMEGILKRAGETAVGVRARDRISQLRGDPEVQPTNPEGGTESQPTKPENAEPAKEEPANPTRGISSNGRTIKKRSSR